MRVASSGKCMRHRLHYKNERRLRSRIPLTDRGHICFTALSNAFLAIERLPVSLPVFLFASLRCVILVSSPVPPYCSIERLDLAEIPRGFAHVPCSEKNRGDYYYTDRLL